MVPPLPAWVARNTAVAMALRRPIEQVWVEEGRLALAETGTMRVVRPVVPVMREVVGQAAPSVMTEVPVQSGMPPMAQAVVVVVSLLVTGKSAVCMVPAAAVVMGTTFLRVVLEDKASSQSHIRRAAVAVFRSLGLCR